MSAAEPQNLKRAAARGVVWKIAAEAVTQLTRLALILILTRMLMPADFGVASLVLAFSIFVPVLADLGLGAALIQRREISEVECSTVFWASVALGTTFTIVGVVLAWPFSTIFDQPALQGLFAAYSLSFLIASLSSVPFALLTRAMDFRSLEIRVITSTLIAAAVSITLAALGLGAWALVVGEMTNRSVSLVLLWSLCKWHPVFVFSWKRFRGMLAFSSGILGSHLLMQLAQTLQSLLVGRLLGAHSLGRLTVSQSLVLLPFSRVAAPIQEVMFPTFSRMQDEPGRVLNAWNRVNQVTVAVAIPTLTGLVILAPEFTDLVLGERWQGTASVVRALALSGVAVALQRLAFGVLAALAYYRSLVWIGLGAVLMSVLAVVLGSRFGLTATAFALALQTVIIQTVVMSIAARSLNARLVDVLRPLARIACAGAVMAVAVVATVLVLHQTNSSGLAILACGTIVGALVYIPLLMLLESELLAELVSFFRGRSHREDAGSARRPLTEGRQARDAS